MFHTIIIPPASIIERKPLAGLLLPDRLVPLVSVLIFVMGKEMLTRVLVELQDAVYT